MKQTHTGTPYLLSKSISIEHILKQTKDISNTSKSLENEKMITWKTGTPEKSSSKKPVFSMSWNYFKEGLSWDLESLWLLLILLQQQFIVPMPLSGSHLGGVSSDQMYATLLSYCYTLVSNNKEVVLGLTHCDNHYLQL